ncbi:MAG: PAS domain S-box protein [Rhodothermales bacterium]
MSDPLHILVVDDNPHALKATVRVLEKAGWTTASATNGNEALRHIRDLRPQLVLLDVVLPDIDGLEVLRQIRADEALKYTAVVFLSSQKTESGHAAEGLDVGADGYIVQPIDNHELVARVRLHMRQQELTERLRKSESLMARAQRIAQLGSWELDMVAGELSWSEEVYRIFGLTPDAFGATFEAFLATVHPDDRAMMLKAQDAALHGEIALDIEHRIVRPDGSMRWVHELGELELDHAGTPVRLTGTVRDITDRKWSEESVAALEARLRQVSEALPIHVWTADPEGEVDFANSSFLTFTGADKEEGDIQNWQKFVHPDDMKTGQMVWDRAHAASSSYTNEMRLRHHTGEYRWLQVHASPIRDEGGRISHWFGTAIDIHETKRLERRLKTILESITDAFFTLDRNWRFTYINAEAERLLHRERGELLGTMIWDEFPEAVGTESDIEYNRAMREGVSRHFIQHYPPLGRWFEANAYPSEEGLAVYFRDITKQYEDEQQLRLQRAALEAAANSIAITDRDGRLIWVNPSFAMTYGLEEEDVTGRKPGDLIGSGLHDKAFFEDMWETILAGNVWSGEIINRRTDGSLISEEMTITPVRDATGEIAQFIAIKQDVTVRRESERKLREQAALLDKATDAILVRELDHTIVYWNRSAETLYGWTAKEAIGQSIEQLLYSDPTAFRAATETTLSAGEWSGELDQITQDGREITVQGRWTLLRDGDGRPQSILAINTDITEKKHLEQQFLRAQRMESIGTLAGGIAHDLNNLLSPIMMGVDILKDGESDERRLKVIESMRQSVQRGSHLVRQVLSFARGVDGARVTLFLDQVVREVESMVGTSMPRNVRVTRSTALDLWPVLGDPTQLNQVVLNLALNAADAMPDGGTVTISTENVEVDAQYAVMNHDVRPGRYVVLEVVDEGIGMTADVQERIFEPFFSTKEVGKGTGLGLSTVLGIVRSHGGFMNVYSEPGRGSTFHVYLPVQGDGTATEAPDEVTESFPRGNGEQILVVDDELSILTITRHTLETYGYRVITAEDGAQAIGLYAMNRQSVALVITDMRMPAMDGSALIKAVRRMDETAKIIASSGLYGSGNVAKATSAGVGHFLEKPFTAGRLLTLVREVLDSD